MKTWKFPAGEIGISEIEDHNYALTDYSSDGIMRMMMFANACPWGVGNLTIGYMPYGRQDRICHDGEAFSLKVIADMINSCRFREVIILEPHSLVTPALINNCTVIDMARFIFAETEGKRIVAPDAGAAKRAEAIAAKSGNGKPVVQCLKRRLSPERISLDVILPDGDSIKGEDCVIVDDICDGGGTFVACAAKLKQRGARRITLCVAHGLYTKGLSVFDGLIDEVYSVRLTEQGQFLTQKDK